MEIGAGLVGPQKPDAAQQRLREVANDLEKTFISEMLKAAKYGEPRESFGGGIGEEQFSSFLRDQHAEMMVQAGGLGLSERIFNALNGRQNG